MVRMTIACAACRRSKIKCLHTGVAPCQKCIRTGRQATCELAEPVLKRRPRYNTTASVWPELEPGRLPVESIQVPLPSSPPAPVQEPQPVCTPAADQPGGISHVSYPTAAVIYHASILFVAKFPDLPFVHLPSVACDCTSLTRSTIQPSAGVQPVRAAVRALYAALVGLMAPLMGGEGTTSGQVALWAEMARETAMAGLHSADVALAQTLAVLAMREWGLGRAHAAWMYSGMASRMVQALSHQPKYAPPSSSHEAGVFNRTFWACFILDRQITCIQPHPPTMPLACITQSWPWSGQDFLFGELSSPSLLGPPKTNSELEHCELVTNIDHAHRLAVEGFDIWYDVLRWVVSGGRRRFPHESPWDPDAAWMKLRERLRLWRRRHGRRLRFPETSVETYVSVGTGEMFVFLNLIYYASVLWLGREWVPFLPSASTLPEGPADPPLLPLTAPSNWWAHQAAELFGAASHITQMLFSLSTCAHIPQHQPPPQPLSQDPCHPCAAALRTPFAGICAFSAATMNIYVTCFPLMNLNRSLATAARDHERDVAYLDEFRRIWPLGNGWWTTIHQLKELYQRASRDGHAFQGGKTRNDYLELESSIHDPTGLPPEKHSHSLNIARMDRDDVSMSTGTHGKPCAPENNQNQQHSVTSDIVRPETNADASAEPGLTDIVDNRQEAVSIDQTADFASNWSDVWLLLGD